MACGLGLGSLLFCLVQAELVCSSWGKKVHRPQNSNMHAGFSLPDERLGKLSSLQNQLRRDFSSSRSVQSRSFNTNPAANMSYGQRLSTNSFVHALSQPVQGSGRLMKSTLVSNPNGHRTGLSATLFGPVAPGPHSSVRMQTYAQGRARRVPSSGAKVGSVLPQTAARKSYHSPWFALNVAGGSPRSWLSSLAAPRSSSSRGVVVHELPEPFGGSAIRRLGQQTKTFIVQKPQQVYVHPQWVSPYKSELKSLHPGSDWMKQNQSPVQKLRQISTQPQQVPVYNPDLPRVHPASTWSKVRRPYRL